MRLNHLSKKAGEVQIFVSTNVYTSGFSRERSKTKYSIDGSGSYSIRQMVLALVHKIVASRPSITSDELFSLFSPVKPWKLLLRDFDEAVNLSDKDKDYFTDVSEAVFIDGRNYAVLNWWGSGHVDALKDVALKFGLST